MPTICCLLCTAIGLVAQPFSVAEEEIPSYLPNGKCFVTRVASESLQRSPPWRPSEANPPLAARRAISLGERKKSELVKDTPGDDKWTWHLEAVSLVPRDNDRWYWLIEYEAIPDSGLVGRAANLSLVVLMDGSLIQPEVQDRDDRRRETDKGRKKKVAEPSGGNQKHSPKQSP